MPKNNLARAASDLREGLLSLHLWPMLAWLEIKHRYRRSLLGPLWLTLSTALFIAGMGSLYGVLFGQSRSGYLHYLSVGLIVWLFIAGLINDGCQTFIGAEGFVRQTRIPLSVHALRVVFRHVLILAHNSVIIIVVSAYFRPAWGWGMLSVPFGLLLIAANGFGLALLLGLTSARFRDVPQITASLVQLLFFITPIFWRPEMLTGHQWVATFNPFYHLIELVRAPILGYQPDALSWFISIGMTSTVLLIAVASFARFRARIAYWT